MVILTQTTQNRYVILMLRDSQCARMKEYKKDIDALCQKYDTMLTVTTNIGKVMIGKYHNTVHVLEDRGYAIIELDDKMRFVDSDELLIDMKFYDAYDDDLDICIEMDKHSFWVRFEGLECSDCGNAFEEGSLIDWQIFD